MSLHSPPPHEASRNNRHKGVGFHSSSSTSSSSFLSALFASSNRSYSSRDKYASESIFFSCVSPREHHHHNCRCSRDAEIYARAPRMKRKSENVLRGILRVRVYACLFIAFSSRENTRAKRVRSREYEKKERKRQKTHATSLKRARTQRRERTLEPNGSCWILFLFLYYKCFMVH